MSACVANREISNSKQLGCKPSRPKINLYGPRFDRNSYCGRVLHFYELYHPRHLFSTAGGLEHARKTMEKYRCGDAMDDVTVDQLWRAKYLYDSAFDPQVDEKLPFFGRPSAYVPYTTFLLTGMLHNYHQIPHIALWQTAYQAFNTCTVFTNQRFCPPVSDRSIITSFAIASAGALAAALLWRKCYLCKAPIFGRLGPMFGVAAGEIINVPVRRYNELMEGITIYDANDKRLGTSTLAAKYSVFFSTVRRLVLILPPLFLTPWYIEALDVHGLLRRYPRSVVAHHALFLGVWFIFISPFCRAIFKDRSSIRFSSLQPDLQLCIKQTLGDSPPPERVFFRTELHC